MLLRSVLLILVCALAGCGRQPGSTAMASSEPVKLTFSPEPGIRAGYVRIRPNKIAGDSNSVQWEWRIKGEGLPGGAKFYNSRMTESGTGPVTLNMQISGSVGFDARVVLKLTEESGQVKADQRVEISAGKDMGKVEAKSWTVPGTLESAVKVDQAKLAEAEMPVRVKLATVGGQELAANFEQSRF